ncbi:MAG: hypothetical protein H6807_12045 [Planctomycetes bacterium]|nr:hypothetical protein [Planctomycetota bacterium]
MNFGFGRIGIVFGILVAVIGGSGGPLSPATSLVFGLAGLRFARSTAEAIAVVERDVTLEQFEARIADPEGEGEACDILSMILYRSSLAEEDAARVGDILAGHLVGPATEGRYSPGPAALLLQLRGEAAMPAILAPEVLSITNPRLVETLWAIRGAGLDLPADRADRMLAALLTVDPLPEQEQALVDEFLADLGKRGEALHERLDEFLADDRTRLGALRGLSVLAGVETPWATIYDGDALGPNESAFLALATLGQSLGEWSTMLDLMRWAELDGLPAAIRALAAQGRPDLARDLRAVVLAVDGRGWKTDQLARRRLIDALGDDGRKRIEALDARLRGERRRLAEAAWKTVLAHPEDFGGRKP